LEVKLIGAIPDVEKIIASSSKSTRSKSADKILAEIDLIEARKHLGRLMSYGHEGAAEFAFFIFSVNNVSRVCTHQLVRHRIASYLQMSSRHVDLSEYEFITPPSIQENAEALKVYSNFIIDAKKRYKELLNLGIEKEDARFLLPDSIGTHIVIGMNARSLNNFFGHRLCGNAQWEIRQLAQKMRDLVKDITPSLFWAENRPCIIRGFCPQKPSCKYVATKAFKREREKYLMGYPHEQ